MKFYTKPCQCIKARKKISFLFIAAILSELQGKEKNQNAIRQDMRRKGYKKDDEGFLKYLIDEIKKIKGKSLNFEQKHELLHKNVP